MKYIVDIIIFFFFQNTCTVSLFHTPKLRGIYKKMIPDKYNELIGLQHCKLFVFDDSVIISGANLSTDYFTNRQDRYILIGNYYIILFIFSFV